MRAYRAARFSSGVLITIIFWRTFGHMVSLNASFLGVPVAFVMACISSDARILPTCSPPRGRTITLCSSLGRLAGMRADFDSAALTLLAKYLRALGDDETVETDSPLLRFALSVVALELLVSSARSSPRCRRRRGAPLVWRLRCGQSIGQGLLAVECRRLPRVENHHSPP